MRKWSAIIILGLAQFIMVLDGTVMNVSITTVVRDLDTTVQAMQLAIATVALTMAAFMLTGAGIGDLAALRGRSRIREAEALCAADGLGGFTVMHWVR